LFALLVIAYRFSPRRVFFNCSLAAALANIGLLIAPQELTWLLVPGPIIGLWMLRPLLAANPA
jgi:hypothetical protein